MSLLRTARGPPDPADLDPAARAARRRSSGSSSWRLFAIIFFRLWFLQVLTGDAVRRGGGQEHDPAASAVAPARGEILDRNGRRCSSPRPHVWPRSIVPDDLPVKVDQTNILNSYPQDDAVYSRLARQLHKSPQAEAVRGRGAAAQLQHSDGQLPAYHDARPVADRVHRRPADRAEHLRRRDDRRDRSRTDLQYYVAERQNQFPRRAGPAGDDLAGIRTGRWRRRRSAPLAGSPRPGSRRSNFKGANLNAIVGQSGLEYEYDKYLRGSYGYQNVKVNALRHRRRPGTQEGADRRPQPEAVARRSRCSASASRRSQHSIGLNRRRSAARSWR